jgi:hypothetical protein
MISIAHMQMHRTAPPVPNSKRNLLQKFCSRRSRTRTATCLVSSPVQFMDMQNRFTADEDDHDTSDHRGGAAGELSPRTVSSQFQKEQVSGSSERPSSYWICERLPSNQALNVASSCLWISTARVWSRLSRGMHCDAEISTQSFVGPMVRDTEREREKSARIYICLHDLWPLKTEAAMADFSYSPIGKIVIFHVI